MSIEAALERHEEALMELANVVGVGIGERGAEAVIKVFVARKVPAAGLAPADVVPEMLDGYGVDVEELGTVTAYGGSGGSQH